MVDQPTYAGDLAFLKDHVDVVELVHGSTGARVATVPAWQGRVATSGFADPSSRGFGWIHRKFIASGESHPTIHAYGGEDRFWLGPEGGQFSIFNPVGTPFDLTSWRTPAGIDTDAYEVASSAADHVVCRHRAQFENWSGFVFDVGIERELRLVDAASEFEVAFESVNTITNLGDHPWRKATGLLSIWTIGMFAPSDATAIVVPYVAGEEEALGPIVNDVYFGKIPADRLQVDDRAIYFRGDGKHRSKLGVSPARARNRLGSWDGRCLTIVEFDLPAGATDYVNQLWELQDEPYVGDAIHSYNDGAWEEGGEALGPFYELETSSPAVEIECGASLTHRHRTRHLIGARDFLDAMARESLGVSLAEIEAF